MWYQIYKADYCLKHYKFVCPILLDGSIVQFTYIVGPETDGAGWANMVQHGLLPSVPFQGEVNKVTHSYTNIDLNIAIYQFKLLSILK